MSSPEQFTATITTSDETEPTAAILRDTHQVKSDEPHWLPPPFAGEDAYPAPVDYLLASLAICQTSVLKQCLEGNGIEVYHLRCEAEIDSYSRDPDHPDEMPAHTATRIDHITVAMTLRTLSKFEDVAEICLTTYDEGCIVGQSIGDAIDYTPVTALEIDDDLGR